MEGKKHPHPIGSTLAHPKKGERESEPSIAVVVTEKWEIKKHKKEKVEIIQIMEKGLQDIGESKREGKINVTELWVYDDMGREKLGIKEETIRGMLMRQSQQLSEQGIRVTLAKKEQEGGKKGR